MTAVAHAGDQTGAETLDIMREAPRYNAWQYSRVAPYLGRRICEIGSGIGNMSAHLLGAPRDLALLTDPDPAYLDCLRQTFRSRPEVAVEQLTLPDAAARDRFAHYELDTVVALNVLEHIADDAQALRTAAALVRPGGRVVVLVPALPALYGSLDQALGHLRRYTRATIASMMRASGLQVERTFYFNVVGGFGWWFSARVRRAALIPRWQLRRFDALVPLLRLEDRLPLPFGQSVICVGRAQPERAL